ncbi:MAG: SPOR domain-containing protein [Gammaproteobacteria bacterium]|nr:SPOR domain-containing protein [Gammaproteobacteria bacterium]
MERRLQERMVGAGVLVFALVIFGPMILDGGPEDLAERREVPGQRSDELRTHTFRIEPGTATKLPAAGEGDPERPTPAPAVSPPPPQAVAQTEAVAAKQAGLETAPSVPAPAVRASPRPDPSAAPPSLADKGGSKRAAAEAAPPPAAGQGWAVQIGTFAEKANADRVTAQLRKAGFETYVSPTSSGTRTLYRVRVGPVDSRNEVGDLARRLSAAGHQGQVVSE